MGISILRKSVFGIMALTACAANYAVKQLQTGKV